MNEEAEPAVAPVVVIGVLTFRRPDGLAALLPQLIEQATQLDARRGSTTTVLVVDNDREDSARSIAAAAGARVRYVHEAVPGIAAGRARAVAESAGADALVFIDDDEEPAEGWLAQLVATWESHGRPAGVVGRVSPTYAGETDPWIAAGGFFVRRQLATGTPVAAASSANLLLDRRLLTELSLTFDAGLGMRGGEDTLLTETLSRTGHTLVWCNEAEVIDHITPERMSRRWVLRRAFSHGAVRSRIELDFAERVVATRLKLVVLGLARAAGGVVAAVVGTVTRNARIQARGLRLVCRGAGLVTGAWGREHAEYARGPGAEVGADH